MGQQNPAPVENGGKHPIIYRLSTGVNHPFGSGFCNNQDVIDQAVLVPGEP